MKIGVVGLGKMGGNMSRRLMKAGHDCVVYARTAQTREALVKDGALEAVSLGDLVNKLTDKPRAVWLMLPAGQATDEAVTELGTLLAPDDIVIDGGNSFYKDDIRRAKTLAGKGIRYIDCGTSGGVWGIERGYCMMIGGPKEAVDYLDPIFSALSPGLGTIARTPGRDKEAPRGPAISSKWCITALSTG
jgi:6-phosphogluconate dehydrogenase